MNIIIITTKGSRQNYETSNKLNVDYSYAKQDGHRNQFTIALHALRCLRWWEKKSRFNRLLTI